MDGWTDWYYIINTSQLSTISYNIRTNSGDPIWKNLFRFVFAGKKEKMSWKIISLTNAHQGAEPKIM